ncbi:GFA family protein [Mesorhizobium sp. B2-3-3]|nr:GFA family protein [Mesorhizobium sp. B2-3-3]
MAEEWATLPVASSLHAGRTAKTTWRCRNTDARLLLHRAVWSAEECGLEGGLERITRGGCLCGAVSYELSGELRPIVACHCNQCRKATGHFGAATQVEQQRATITGDTLRWFRSSEHAERGFCSVCGGNLFWRRVGSPFISVWAGTIDGKTGLKMESQLYPESAGDYYELPAVPVVPQSELK